MSGSKPLNSLIKLPPRPFDEAGVERLREDFGEAWSRLSAAEEKLLSGVAGSSPYLRRMMQRDPERVFDILHASTEAMVAKACDEARAAGAMESKADCMSALRGAKELAALSVALADVAGAVGTMEAAALISEFADAAVDAALQAAAIKNKAPNGVAGIASIAMGKLGAGELNYSSDIDLVIIYEPDAMGLASLDARHTAVRIAKDMVAILQDQTADGYVFRTDLRLRPDPGVSPLALSAQAAEAYYESFGQNWERMAYIKSRAHAGDKSVGEAFLKALRPFVWRKFLDFATIEDVKAVKRQMHSAKGGGDIEFAGHDIKTGRGGIREIEFFAQTQQLILGGKNEALRSRRTLRTLAHLCEDDQVSEAARDELTADYLYLRHVEHRLQMINDDQTHKIPRSDDDIARLAVFAGEESASAFEQRLLSVLSRVKVRFDRLFREDAQDVEQPGPLVFTGVEGDPATLKTLEELGFKRAGEISGVIRRWHTGAIRATRTERARAILTRLMAPLLLALSRSSDPDAAFFAFDRFLSGLPAGVQIFSLLANNVALFGVLIEIITISPFLGAEMSKRANFVEALLETGLGAPLPERDSYEATLADALMRSGDDYEAQLNTVRRWAGEAHFFVAAKLAAGAIDGAAAGRHFSAIAQACVGALMPAAEEEMRRAHGPIEGGLAIVALGRLGAQEMTAASDLDLIFVYDAPERAESDPPEGRRALSSVEYFTRLVRRLVTAFSAATEEGALYEVDMALRPSGGAGPTAVSLAAFRRYYEADAWTWEAMALTKARVIAGPPALVVSISADIDAILRRSRDAAKIAQDVEEMRQRLLKAKPARGPWNVKRVQGGLTEIDFILQYLALIHGADYGRPPTGARAAIAWFSEKKLMSPDHAELLLRAHHMYSEILEAGRAATGGHFDASEAGEVLAARMSRLCDAASIEEAEANLALMQQRVAEAYRQVLGLDLGESG